MRTWSLTLLFLASTFTLHPTFSADDGDGSPETRALFQQIVEAGHSPPDLSDSIDREAFLKTLVEANGQTLHNEVWEVEALEGWKKVLRNKANGIVGRIFWYDRRRKTRSIAYFEFDEAQNAVGDIIFALKYKPDDE